MLGSQRWLNVFAANVPAFLCFFVDKTHGSYVMPILLKQWVPCMVRFKNRYLVLELIWKDGRLDDSLNEAAMLAVFRESIQQVFGDYGLGSALASFQVKHFNPVTNICIVRCSRDEHRQVWCALTLITEIRHRVMMLRVLHLTGTVASAKEVAAACSTAVLEHLPPLKRQHQALSEQAADRLEHMEP